MLVPCFPRAQPVNTTRMIIANITSNITILFDAFNDTSLAEVFENAQSETTNKPGWDEAEFQKSLHLSIAIAGMIILAFMLFHVRNSGYVISESKYWSTDFHMWVLMLAVSVLWTLFTILTGWYLEDRSRRYCTEAYWFGLYFCLGRFVFVPWILLLACLRWLSADLMEWTTHKFKGTGLLLYVVAIFLTDSRYYI